MWFNLFRVEVGSFSVRVLWCSNVMRAIPNKVRECCILLYCSDPAMRSSVQVPAESFLYTISCYLVLRETSAALSLLACCEKHGNRAVMTPSLSLKVTCARVCSLCCAVPHKLTWQGIIDPWLHESCTMDTHCTARTLPCCWQPPLQQQTRAVLRLAEKW